MDFVGIAWLVILVVLVAIEIATFGLTTIWFAGGALVAFLAEVLGAPLGVQVALFLVVSVALLVLTRPMAIRYLNKDRIKTNAESLIGKSAVVIEEVDNLKATGAVMVDGQEWTARTVDDSQLLKKDQIVEIKEIRGVKLIVSEKN